LASTHLQGRLGPRGPKPGQGGVRILRGTGLLGGISSWGPTRVQVSGGQGGKKKRLFTPGDSLGGSLIKNPCGGPPAVQICLRLCSQKTDKPVSRVVHGGSVPHKAVFRQAENGGTFFGRFPDHIPIQPASRPRDEGGTLFHNPKPQLHVLLRVCGGTGSDRLSGFGSSPTAGIKKSDVIFGGGGPHGGMAPLCRGGTPSSSPGRVVTLRH